MIIGKYNHKWLDRMKQDTNLEMLSISYDTLSLIDLIKNTVLAQTEDHHPFAIVYNQELSLYGFQHNTMTSDQ